MPDARDSFYTAEELANRCYLLENEGIDVGYYRCLGNAQSIAARLSAPTIIELFPPERIACEDDPLDDGLDPLARGGRTGSDGR